MACRELSYGDSKRLHINCTCVRQADSCGAVLCSAQLFAAKQGSQHLRVSAWTDLQLETPSMFAIGLHFSYHGDALEGIPL